LRLGTFSPTDESDPANPLGHRLPKVLLVGETNQSLAQDAASAIELVEQQAGPVRVHFHAFTSPQAYRMEAE
jgi:hypothetical protein